MSAERIVRRTLRPSKVTRPRRAARTDWARVDAMTEEELESAAQSDPDNPLWTPEELRQAALAERPDMPKRPVTMRLDADVVEFFQQAGRGYQTRINAVLRAYVRGRDRSRRHRGAHAKP